MQVRRPVQILETKQPSNTKVSHTVSQGVESINEHEFDQSSGAVKKHDYKKVTIYSSPDPHVHALRQLAAAHVVNKKTRPLIGVN